jgi:ATP-GRASP peptide maturase of grasp-with-spasm system
MILIITSSTDNSTNNVIDWIHYLGFSYKRINSDHFWCNNMPVSYLLSSTSSSIKGIDQMDLDKIESVWFRKNISEQFMKEVSLNLSKITNESLFTDLYVNLMNEYSFGKKGVFSSIQKKAKRTLGISLSTIYKIDVLNIAKELGLDIPATIITNSKKELESFFYSYKSIITKAIYEAPIYVKNSDGKAYSFLNYTEEINEQVIKDMPECFFPSVFQENLNKDFEIRCFYINGEIYSMAIFSQLDKQTKTDFRKYNRSCNNRNVPYKLPSYFERQIVKLMTKLGLNTGSIDIIKTKEGKFVFLEINPTGQYGMTSVPCNYYLDKKIAEFLSHG